MSALVLDHSVTQSLIEVDTTGFPSATSNTQAIYFTDLRQAPVGGYNQNQQHSYVSIGPSGIFAVGSMSHTSLATAIETEDFTATPAPPSNDTATSNVSSASSNYKSLKYAILLSGLGALTLVL
ncbi:hypothetical protein JA1_001255 [Spathaspora sp. JA1]|nr:hypothetical protein JA1_001255 [Spathaspora sp. JA1]